MSANDVDVPLVGTNGTAREALWGTSWRAFEAEATEIRAVALVRSRRSTRCSARNDYDYCFLSFSLFFIAVSPMRTSALIVKTVGVDWNSSTVPPVDGAGEGFRDNGALKP